MPPIKKKKPPLPYPEEEENFIFPDDLDTVYTSTPTTKNIKIKVTTKKKNELPTKHRKDDKTGV